MHAFNFRIWLVGLLALFVAPALSAGAGADGILFFEQKIRPVLVKECYSCHSAEARKLKGGLRLDTRAGVLEGGDSGPAVVPGKPGESLLLEALRHEGIAMPPKTKLPAAVVADFESWVRMGAPDPRDGQATRPRPLTDVDAGRRFWAYRPPQRHAPPAVAGTDWPETDIDRFILAALEARGIRPVGDADRARLARRLYFDLIGLPPTPAEVDAFVADGTPAAYERLVERLLASPHFGERWGRHWLDVARFGESLTLRGYVLASAWRYRDYVIDAFNSDLPFDRFIREQVAGDLLPATCLAERRRQLIAATFLTLGNTNLEEQDKSQLVMDVVDEQLDTLGKALLGQTIGCARCHDHKFDPIPTRDYYALAGILRNVKTLEHFKEGSKWIEVPLPMPPDRQAAIARHEAAIAAIEARVKAGRERALARGKGLELGTGRVSVGEVPGIVVDDAQAEGVGHWTVSRSAKQGMIGAGTLDDMNAGKGEKTLTFRPELPDAGKYHVWLAYATDDERASAVPLTIHHARGESTVPVDLHAAPPIEGRFVSLGEFEFDRDGQGYVRISNAGTRGSVVADAVLFFPARASGPVAEGAPQEEEEPGPALADLLAELKRLRESAPAQDQVIRVIEEPEIGTARIHIRGSVSNLGETVPRGFLSVATPPGDPPLLPTGESGRRELADWLASRGNPLTARVFVNRTWYWLFGAGLVRTTDNFGASGEVPSHPELLDDLAVRFMTEDGWSIKALIRRIVLSHTYRLSSAANARATAADPENRLWWRMPRRRLDAECIRDTILSVSGRLETDMGGPSFASGLASDFRFAGRDNRRRSVYVPAFRNSLPGLFQVFDFADPSMVVGCRNVSTSAPQALYLMNDPFVLEQAQHAGRRLLAEPGLDDEGRLIRAYRLALGRPPTPSERRFDLQFLAETEGSGSAPDREETWAQLFQALFSSLDFRYLR